MRNNGWLADLKDGDKVILAQDGYGGFRRIATVRLTATQIIVTGTSRRFDRQTGRVKGKWEHHAPSIEPYTPEAALTIRLTRTALDTREALGKLKPGALDLSQALKLHGTLTQVLRALADCGVYPREEVDKR